MKPLFSLLLALFCGSALVAAKASPAASADQDEAVRGSNAFAVDLYGRLSSQPGNLFFSPESISTAFAMTYAGAHGQTATEMARVFHFTLPPERLHPAIGTLLAGMNAPHPGYALRVADALWAEKDENFLPAYLKLVQTNYGAGFHPVEFKSAPDSVRVTINQWVEKQTNNKIQNLLGPGTVTPLSRLILTNAIYFKAAWADQFSKSATENKDFHLSASKTIQAPTMYNSGGYYYLKGPSFQALLMPYEKDEISMLILLPNSVDGLPALERSLSASNLDKWTAALSYEHEVIVHLPRFKITQQFELSSTLKDLGMKTAFDGNSADFSGMTGDKSLVISAAIHKAYIDLDENGTEAAAATAVIMEMATAMQSRTPPPPPIIFTADHPFLFLIRDNASGAILFMGRITDPTE
ncbi:MAG: serpin family protein [Terracidiphilus sp.]|nr:serpin family protein [Terracidiphilus sp.]MDR3796900.1 serpin family protein [Terracidiphilus sp.]